jgi:chorismate mutase
MSHNLFKGLNLFGNPFKQKQPELLVRTSKQLYDMYNVIMLGDQTKPALFKVPILATIAWTLKIPIKLDNGEQVVGETINDYMAPTVRFLASNNVKGFVNPVNQQTADPAKEQKLLEKLTEPAKTEETLKKVVEKVKRRANRASTAGKKK